MPQSFAALPRLASDNVIRRALAVLAAKVPARPVFRTCYYSMAIALLLLLFAAQHHIETGAVKSLCLVLSSEEVLNIKYQTRGGGTLCAQGEANPWP